MQGMIAGIVGAITSAVATEDEYGFRYYFLNGKRFYFLSNILFWFIVIILYSIACTGSSLFEHLWKTHLSLLIFSSTSWIFTRDVAVQLQRNATPLRYYQIAILFYDVDRRHLWWTRNMCCMRLYVFRHLTIFKKYIQILALKIKLKTYSFEFLKFNFSANIRQSA